eukprot:5279915-Amphidinium_carterae.4
MPSAKYVVTTVNKTKLNATHMIGVDVQERCTARCGGVPWWRTSGPTSHDAVQLNSGIKCKMVTMWFSRWN